MLERIRDLGPVVLVPAAWAATAASVLGALGSDGMLIAHAVMVMFITFFAVTGWSAMSDGAFRAWRLVMVVGIPVTLAGLAGFFVPEFDRLLFSVSLVGWMVLPAGGLAYTGREVAPARRLYFLTAGLSALGAVVATGGLLAGEQGVLLVGIAFVGVGQTVGIADASYRDR
ncbi:hypothetical protein GRX03_12820 [Halovenus sp. WSH3]|uniref:Uncharacterized protein n=1 Tax=Halovenus carboxidivorans TaxID=2692199 RepID=A0A6B0T380_9EURY|nr:hypothetical protein [Halovenus carboxidivorans]MXR52485.1 hypothetical protein [Halovenus carboxidivorans]